MQRKYVAASVALVVTGAAIGAIYTFLPGGLTLLHRGAEHDLVDAGAIPPSRTDAPRVLVLALDGVDRKLLYPMIRNGELPELGRLLGGDAPKLPHARFDESILSTLPSSTLAAWATVFTGTPPAVHGVAGNEYFVRKERRLAAPAPVSILDPSPVTLTYSDGYANKLLSVPTIYQQLRERDPSANAWVSMSQFHAGAEKLLFASAPVILGAVAGALKGALDVDRSMQKTPYAALDNEVVDNVIEALRGSPQAPRLLTVYLTGTDYVAHGSEGGPDENRMRFLVEVTDPAVGRLRAALEEADRGAPRWTVVVSDHGHTEVLHDERHALSTEDADDPPAVVRAAGYRLRPFTLETKPDADFQAVMAYGGALAYVYVADRSTCAAPGSVCDFSKPARYREDIVPLAQAFSDASDSGKTAPSMKDSLDLVLVRTAQPEGKQPFQVYLGHGKSEPLETTLQRIPHARYVRFAERLRELGVGPNGDHAGDIVLLARNGNEDDVQRRFYFASLYRSWHGSPSKSDSEISFIVSHPEQDTAAIDRRVRAVCGERMQQQDVGNLTVDLVSPRAH
ncbi:MAG: hypothetical protein EOP08_00210 [Proteobacteria bacterium]|nr:MAG: hypothetical protein EOP08_00210 [Pseudomonadota bacterium]